MLTKDSVLKLSDSISFQSLGDGEGGIVLELEDGQLHTCNDTTVAFLGLVDGEKTLSQIAGMMQEEFEVEKGVLLADLQELSLSLQKEGILN